MVFHALSLTAVVLCFATGCTPPPSNALVYAQPEDPKTLDPINTDIAEAVHVITNLFDTLVTYHDETMEIVPSLAERWETSDDGLSWSFHLRPGVQFHDGAPLNAEAVKISLERLIQAEHPLAFDKARPYQASYNMIAAVEAPDERTVVLKLHHPSAILLANLAMFPASVCSPAALRDQGADFAEHPVGTGPFQFVKWSRDQQLVCAAFDEHWRGRPKIDTLVWVPVKENATRVQRLERGEVHVAENLAPPDMEHLAQNPQLQVLQQVGLNVAYLTMQTEKPPLDNRKVREAIYVAIDKPTLIKVGYAGQAQPAKSMVPSAMWGHNDSLVDHSFDPARARQLLQEAATESGFKLPLKLELSVMAQARPYLPLPDAIAGFIKDSLRDVGIEADIMPRTVNQHFDALMAGKHELGLAGWNSDNSDPDNFLYSLLDPDNISELGNNLSRWRHDRFHELLLAGQQESDTAKRLEIYKEAQQIVLDEMPVVPLAHTNLRAAHAKRLKGYSLHPTGLVRLRGVYFEDTP